MNDLSLDDGSFKHIIPNKNAPNDQVRPPAIDYGKLFPKDNMTSGDNLILSRIRTYLSLEVEHRVIIILEL